MAIRATSLVLIASAAAALASGPFFDEAPEPLPDYLHRLPAESLREIFPRTPPAPPPGPAVDFRAKIETLQREAAADTPVAELLRQTEALLAQARRRDYEGVWQGAEVSTLLHDLRDLFAFGEATSTEMADYIGWRLAHPAPFGIATDEAQRTRPYWQKPDLDVALQKELADRAQTASPAMRPHWRYLAGALGFKSGEDTESERQFQQVLDDFPEHPRAETALFMMARCELSRTRTDFWNEAERAKAAERRPVARAAFEEYLRQYPDGRFVGDTLGWLGALDFADQKYADALRRYVA